MHDRKAVSKALQRGRKLIAEKERIEEGLRSLAKKRSTASDAAAEKRATLRALQAARHLGEGSSDRDLALARAELQKAKEHMEGFEEAKKTLSARLQPLRESLAKIAEEAEAEVHEVLVAEFERVLDEVQDAFQALAGPIARLYAFRSAAGGSGIGQSAQMKLNNIALRDLFYQPHSVHQSPDKGLYWMSQRLHDCLVDDKETRRSTEAISTMISELDQVKTMAEAEAVR